MAPASWRVFLHRLACVVFVAGLLSGCGDRGSGYPSTSLEGTVTIDGVPLAGGSIQFLPQGTGQGPAVGGTVVEGRYAVDAVPLGKVRAIPTAVRKTNRLPDVDGMERWETENLVPEKYRGGIVIDVTADRATQDFDLQTE